MFFQNTSRMSLLLRTVLRHQSNGLSGLLRTQFRSISVYSVKFNEANRKKSDSASAVTKSSNISDVDLSTDMLPFTDRVKENTKTVSYMGVILVGVAVAGVLFYACLRELLSSTSSNNVYSAAFAACIDDPRVQDALGPPIKAYGEESRRGRRQHVASLAVDRHGQPSMQVRFYIQGIRNKATVQLEKRMVISPFDLPQAFILWSVFIIFKYFQLTFIEGWPISVFLCSTRSLSAHHNHTRGQSLRNGWNSRIDAASTTNRQLKILN